MEFDTKPHRRTDKVIIIIFMKVIIMMLISLVLLCFKKNISGQAKTTGLCQSLSMQLSLWWALFTEITFVFVVLSAMQLSFSEISFPAKFIQLCDDRLLPGHDHGLAAENCSSSICYWYSLFPRSLWAPSYNWMEIEAAVLISSTMIL